MSHANTAPTTRITTQIGVVEKVSFSKWFSVINLGFPSAITDIIAEIVTIITQRIGNMLPIAPLIISARIFTIIVQSLAPSPVAPKNDFFTGIMNKIIPIIEGIKNPAINVLRFLFI